MYYTQISDLEFSRDFKKNYYQVYPSFILLLDIKEIGKQILFLKYKYKLYKKNQENSITNFQKNKFYKLLTELLSKLFN
jgi:hypothetical protein